jgi:C_GCAxxG_C_C family probable redox protein
MRTIKKKTKKSRMSHRAVTFFDSGFHCAESVLMSAKEKLGVRSSAIPRVATGFGAGIGRKGSVCGALTGAIMGIGLAYGRQHPSQDREKAYALARKTFDRFKARFGSPYCMELIGVDLSTVAGREKYHKLHLHTEQCGKLVAACADMLEQALAGGKTGSRTKARTTVRKQARRPRKPKTGRKAGR